MSGLATLSVSQAATLSPADAAALPTPAGADILPAPQIDGVVWRQVIVGDTVYVAGDFDNARPFGSPSGTNTVARTNMLAYNLTTGDLDTSFAPTFDAKIDDMAVTPNHNELIVGGTFTTVNGLPRNRVAVFNLPSDGSPSGATLSTTVVPSVNSEVTSVAASNSAIYLGGWFSGIKGTTSTTTSTRPRVGAVSTTNGAVLPFTVPVDNNWVQSLVVSPDGSQVVLGGSFLSVGGSTNPGFGIYRANATTGAKLPLPANATVHAGGTGAGFQRLASDSTSFYGTMWNFNGNGNGEGVFQASWSSGALVTLEDCHGDSYDAAPIGNIVYVAGHSHNCLTSGGFPQTQPDWRIWNATAWTKAAEGTNTKDTYGYADHPGTPRPALLPFFPQFVAGTKTGKGQATWTVTGNSQYVLYGGEFLKVDGTSQQGIVRFATKSAGNNHVGPLTQLGGPWTPRVRSFTPGEVRVSWPAMWDRDDLTLSYHLYRDGVDIYDTSAANYQWTGGQLNYTDTGLSPGDTPSYVVHATDPDGNDVASSAASTTVASASGLDDYATAVIADGATKFWRLDDSGSTVSDLVGPDYTTAGSGVSQGTPGALDNNSGETGMTLDGSANGYIISGNQILAPNTFSEEVWFKTTSTSGGKIVGFGDATPGNQSDHFDRHIYMDTHGIVRFGIAPDGSAFAVQDPTPLNDGQWHQAVATLGPNGMVLYIDGNRAGAWAAHTTGENYGGYWRLGADSSWSGGNFQGAVDDFSVYPTALTDAQVRNQYIASGRTAGAAPAAPRAATSATARGRRVAWRGIGTASGTNIATWAWRFGDGTTSAAQNPVHIYSRNGTYTATLTVTDSRGYSASAARRITVVNARPYATFTAGVHKKTVSFNAARSSDVDGRVVTYIWKFGDGKTARGASVRHVYKKVKRFSVNLTVIDNSGAKSSVTKKVKTKKR